MTNTYVEPAAHHPANGILRVAISMLFMGCFAFYFGFDFVREWSSLQPALALCTTAWLLSGLVTAGAALWLLLRHTPRNPPLWIGGTGAIFAGATLLTGVLTHVVPCPGPTCVRSRLVSAAGLMFFGVLAFRAAWRGGHKPAVETPESHARRR